jgi:LysM repeat protein
MLLLGSLGCSLGSLIVGESGPTPTPTKSLVSTFTATATHTATAMPTETATPLDTAVPIPTDTPPPSATPTPPYTTYVVQPGDTLSSIAARFDTTGQAIKDLNGLTSDIINIGQELLIPSGENPTSPPPSPTSTSGTAPTATPRPPQPAATSTPRPPTATPEPSHPYLYVDGSMQEGHRGCSNLGVEGRILGAAGNPVTEAVTIRWQLGSYVDYWVTGNPIEVPGVFKFSIQVPNPIYHGTKTSTLQIVQSEANPVPLSEPFTWQVLDCTQGPEFFDNIVFRHR